MTRVGFVVHEGRAGAVTAAGELMGWLARREVMTSDLSRERDLRATDPAKIPALDLVVSVGGDGTLLRAAKVADACGCPVLGVKVGRMGFLTEVEPDEATELLERVLAGAATIEDRLAVVAEAGGAVSLESQWALNEVIVEKLARHRLVRLAVEVDGTYVTTFSADGVIVATPTGSTAYSFSARGPIVTPSVSCLVLTPVAAHMVFDRSFVLDASARVVLQVVGDVDGVLSADGRESIEVPVGTRVLIQASPRPARLVRRDDAPSFLARVRDKFGLPGEPDVGPGG